MNWITDLLSSIAKPFRFWVVVAAWEQGLRVRLGKSTKLLRPGFHLRIPFLDRIYLQSIRLRSISTQNQTMTSRDRKVLTVSYAIRYSIENIVTMYQMIAWPEVTLIQEVLAAAAKHISSNDSDAITPLSIERAASESIGDTAWGLRGFAVNVTSFAYVKTYRLLMNDYERISEMNLEAKDNRNGEH